QRNRQIGIGNKCLPLAFTVNGCQQSVQPRRSQPFGKLEIFQLSQQVGLRMYERFKLSDCDLFYSRPQMIEVDRLVEIACTSADGKCGASHLDLELVVLVDRVGVRRIEGESVEGPLLF